MTVGDADQSRAQAPRASRHPRDMTLNECQAARHLHADGWTFGELRMALGVSDDALERHLAGDCCHPDNAPPVDPNPPLGPHLQRCRLEAEFTQGELGDRVGVSASVIGHWERDLAKPRTYNAWRLEAVLAEAMGHE